MDNDLISREALKKAINTYDTFACLPDGKLYPVRELEHPEMFVTYIHVEEVIKAIDNAPTISPYKALEERPQGEWLVTAKDNDGVHRICCPFCSYEKGSNNTDTIIVTFNNFPKFCENCGADMRKGGAE